MSDVTQEDLHGLVDAARGIAIAENARQALDMPRKQEPAAGQLWRLEWEGLALLAYVDAVKRADNGERVRVVPVTTDPQWGDQYTLIVEEDDSPVGLALAAWVALRTTVPRICLDQPLGEFHLGDTVQETYAAFLEDAPAPAATGCPIVSRLDQRWEYREHVSETITRLAELGESLLEADGERPTLADLVAESGMKTQTFVEAAGLADEAFALLYGQRALQPEQAVRIAEVLDVPLEKVLSTAPRPDVVAVRALATPRMRERFERRAGEKGASVTALRERALVHHFQIAARKTGTDANDISGWEAVFDAWLDSEG